MIRPTWTQGFGPEGIRTNIRAKPPRKELARYRNLVFHTYHEYDYLLVSIHAPLEAGPTTSFARLDRENYSEKREPQRVVVSDGPGLGNGLGSEGILFVYLPFPALTAWQRFSSSLWPFEILRAYERREGAV